MAWGPTHSRYSAAGTIVAALITILGFSYILDAILTWRSDQPISFMLYALTGIGSAIFMYRKRDSETAVSVNTFLVPLGIVELSLSETILLAVIGALAGAVIRGKGRIRDSISLVANEASAAAAAFFAYHALVSISAQTAAIRLFVGSGAYFVTSTFPRAILTASGEGRRIGETWKRDHFWAFPFYLVGASAAGFLSIRNSFVHWEACVLVSPVLYVLYRAHRGRQADMALLQQRTVELEAAKVAAERASRTKTEFLRNISHEFRTPMNGIIGMTSVALDSELPQEARDSLETVQGCAESLLRMLNEILDLAKIEAGKIEIEHLAFNLRAHLNATCRPYVPLASGKGISLDWEVNDDVPDHLAGDPWRLGQVITNLIGNAVKFTSRGEVRLSVSTNHRLPEKVNLHFVVEDTGIGVPLDKQRDIFDAFTQADNSITRKYGGTGLGLAICSRLVEKMGGRIWLESEPDVGSAFHFACDFSVGLPKETSHDEGVPLCRGTSVIN